MSIRILDLDGGLVRQRRLSELAQQCVELRGWGPRLRLACSWPAFTRFESDLVRLLGARHDHRPHLTFVGSGDFHHVSLALARRLVLPCNLLVLDNHPDWMRRIPLLHCGTWLYHAARLPVVRRVFHVGGEVDFDNAYRWLAPWPLLRCGKIVVLPAIRHFRAGWERVPHSPLRSAPAVAASRRRIDELLGPFRDELESLPLYVSLDRDVLRAEHAVVNWDSGHLETEEVLAVLAAFLDASAGLLGMDVVGDWSPVRLQGIMRRLLHWTEHPHLEVDAEHATTINEELNLALVELVREWLPLPTGAGRRRKAA
jgi:hypothetical protein